ncbi:MAG TPA: CDP-glycerol glycerophosphotransferase family protein [Pedococcus sp.]|jgi:hypothetical protein
MASPVRRLGDSLQPVTELARRGGALVADRAVEVRRAGHLRVRAHRDDELDVVAFFSGEPGQLYQLRMWLGPLAELSRHLRVALLLRDARNAAAIAAETDLPVRMSRRTEECNAWVVASGARLVLYVNQNTQNFQTLRLARPAHAHLSHGESEKVSMVSNQLKAYDRVFTAGPAARQRILDHLVDFDASHFLDVGRPQLDVPPGRRHLPRDQRTTVLYAPTWEGDSPAMAYGSVASQGVELARAVLASPAHRLLYRPHPQTGRFSHETREADHRIRDLVAAANAAEPAAGHLVDTGSEFGWQLEESDACVCDVSAVAFDWLATGKPMVLTAGHSDSASAGPTTDQLPRLGPGEAPRVLQRLAEESDPEHHARLQQLAEHHFGDTSPGASMARFVAACRETVAERRARLGEA